MRQRRQRKRRIERREGREDEHPLTLQLRGHTNGRGHVAHQRSVRTSNGEEKPQPMLPGDSVEGFWPAALIPRTLTGELGDSVLAPVTALSRGLCALGSLVMPPLRKAGGGVDTATGLLSDIDATAAGTADAEG